MTQHAPMPAFASAAHVLDTPVAAAFAGGWAQIATRCGTAAALPCDVGPFAACDNDTDLVDLIRARGAPVFLLQAAPIHTPVALNRVSSARGVQMVYCGPVSPIPTTGAQPVLELGSADRPQMLELARLTRPGPFEINTGKLGRFIGLRRQGRLIAMAGCRMSFPGWTEISAVCVHPSAQGEGLATLLIRRLIRDLHSAGQRAFLHTYADNSRAINLYHHLNFDLRTEVHIAQLDVAGRHPS